MSLADPAEMHWPELTRATKTIVVVDVVESVRLMQANEADTIDRWRRFVHEVRSDVLPAHAGRMVKSLGDGMLLEFENVLDAVEASLEVQSRIGLHNCVRTEFERLFLRIGIHRCEVVVDALDIYGTGVNLAARLAALARPGAIVCSPEVRDELVPRLHADVEDLGMCYLKHWPDPVRAFQVGAAAQVVRPLDLSHDPVPCLAVLPFRPQKASAECLAVADLLGEEIVRSLGRTHYLRVISRLSTLAAGHDALTSLIAERLGVSYVVRGQLSLTAAHCINLDIQIEWGSTGTVVEAAAFTASLSDVLAGEDELVQQAVRLVSRCVVNRELDRAQGKPLPSLEAHCLLMSGIGLIHRSAPTDFARAQQVLEALAERVSRRPHGHAWLAKWHAMRVVQGTSTQPEVDASKALDSARRALDAEPGSALAHTMAGLAYGFLAKDLVSAERHYLAALDAHANEALTWLYLATLRAWQSRGEEALQAAQSALKLAPLDPMRYYFESLAGFAALAAGEDQMAMTLCLDSLRDNRMHTATHRTLALAQWRLGLEGEARATIRELMQLEPAFTVTRYLQRFPGGDSRMALENARDLQAAGAPP